MCTRHNAQFMVHRKPSQYTVLYGPYIEHRFWRETKRFRYVLAFFASNNCTNKIFDKFKGRKGGLKTLGIPLILEQVNFENCATYMVHHGASILKEFI